MRRTGGTAQYVVEPGPEGGTLHWYQGGQDVMGYYRLPLRMLPADHPFFDLPKVGPQS